MDKKLVFSSFALKLIAIITMTLDHIGLLLASLPKVTYEIETVSNVFRVFGRFAMPLFIFMIVEGVVHTHSFKKYALRLGIIAALISIVLACVAYIPFGVDVTPIKGAGNIFLDLLLTAVVIYLLNQKNNYLKLLTLLPLAVSIISFAVKCYEFNTKAEILWYPSFLYLQYDWVSIALGVGFYYAQKFARVYVNNLSKRSNVDAIVFDTNGTTQFASNIISLFFLFVVCLIHYLSGYLSPNTAFWDYAIQSYAIICGAFILFYNGKRGYNAKWFQYGCYIYYPLSIAILALIYILIGG